MAYDFNGINQFLFGNVSLTPSPMAFSGWFWRDTDTTSVLYSTTARRSLCRVAIGGAVEAVANDGVEVAAVSTTTSTLNTWNHVFCVFESSTSRKIWLNGGGEGVSVASTAAVGSINSFFAVAANPPNNFLNGRLAEVAFWNGSGVETMGITEAGILAAGYSPRVLANRFGNLTYHKLLVRDIDWNSIGSALGPSNGPTVIEHPRIIYPEHQDNFSRAPGAGSAGRVTPQGIIPFGLNFER